MSSSTSIAEHHLAVPGIESSRIRHHVHHRRGPGRRLGSWELSCAVNGTDVVGSNTLLPG